MKRNRWASLVLIAILLIIGFIIGKLVNTPDLKFGPLDPLEGIAILCTVFVAVYVSSILENQNDRFKIQRELALKRAKDLDEAVHDLASFVSCSEQPIGDTNFRLKKVYMLGNSLNKILKLIKFNNTQFTADFNTLHNNLKCLLTDTPADASGTREVPVKCIRGKYHYSLDRSREIETKMEQLKDCILELQVLIVAK